MMALMSVFLSMFIAFAVVILVLIWKTLGFALRVLVFVKSECFMIIDPTLSDHVELVKSRLADDGIEFPSRSDLVSVSELAKPELFNFFSVHGRTVVIRKSYRRFFLLCRNFNPANFGLTSASFNRHRNEYVLRYYDNFSLAVRDFAFMVQGLCKVALDEAARSFSNG